MEVAMRMWVKDAMALVSVVAFSTVALMWVDILALLV
jgi:hypothetical protein